MKKILAVLLLFILSINRFSIAAYAATVSEIEEIFHSNKMQEYITAAMDTELAPAVSITVSNGNEVMYYNYRFADIENAIPTDEDTLYEIGSVTKAFTALSMLILLLFLIYWDIHMAWVWMPRTLTICLVGILLIFLLLMALSILRYIRQSHKNRNS